MTIPRDTCMFKFNSKFFVLEEIEHQFSKLELPFKLRCDVLRPRRPSANVIDIIV